MSHAFPIFFFFSQQKIQKATLVDIPFQVFRGMSKSPGQFNLSLYFDWASLTQYSEVHPYIVALDVCLGLSCFLPGLRCFAVSWTFSSRIDLYFAPVTFPSTPITFLVPQGIDFTIVQYDLQCSSLPQHFVGRLKF